MTELAHPKHELLVKTLFQGQLSAFVFFYRKALAGSDAFRMFVWCVQK